MFDTSWNLWFSVVVLCIGFHASAQRRANVCSGNTSCTDDESINLGLLQTQLRVQSDMLVKDVNDDDDTPADIKAALAKCKICIENFHETYGENFCDSPYRSKYLGADCSTCHGDLRYYCDKGPMRWANDMSQGVHTPDSVSYDNEITPTFDGRLELWTTTPIQGATDRVGVQLRCNDKNQYVGLSNRPERFMSRVSDHGWWLGIKCVDLIPPKIQVATGGIKWHDKTVSPSGTIIKIKINHEDLAEVFFDNRKIATALESVAGTTYFSIHSHTKESYDSSLEGVAIVKDVRIVDKLDVPVQPYRLIRQELTPRLEDFCTRDNKCRECEGNCDSDDDCIDQYHCYMRANRDHIPPGCKEPEDPNKQSKIEMGYCYKGPPQLRTPSWSLEHKCDETEQCGQCEGFCENDKHCKPGFRCKKRSSTQAVPGCTIGGKWDIPGKGFCYADFPKENYPVGTLGRRNQGDACQGPCTSDYDCLPGLKCLILLSGEAVGVPRCDNSEPAMYTNYCYDPTAYDKGEEGLFCNDKEPCQMCEGDCDHDSDCKGDLRCFNRKPGQKVPGCTAETDGWDYCYKGVPQLVNAGPQGCTPQEKCGACTGPCTSDEDCQTGMLCFQREGSEPVLGCLTGTGDKPGLDYCHKADHPQLKARGWDGDPGACTDTNKCKQCEGHCKTDIDCDEGLSCFQRSNKEDVPGCLDSKSGYANWGFCYKAFYCDQHHTKTHSCCRLPTREEQMECIAEQSYDIKITGRCAYPITLAECAHIAWTTSVQKPAAPEPYPSTDAPPACYESIRDGEKKFFFNPEKHGNTGLCTREHNCFCRKVRAEGFYVVGASKLAVPMTFISMMR